MVFWIVLYLDIALLAFFMCDDVLQALTWPMWLVIIVIVLLLVFLINVKTAYDELE